MCCILPPRLTIRPKNYDFVRQSIAVHQYDPRFAAGSATNLDGDVPVTLVLEGGKQGETVKWEVSGDAKVSPTSSTFDANGEAKVVVTGTGTFENEVTVTGKTMALPRLIL